MEISETTLQNVNVLLDDIQKKAAQGACSKNVNFFYNIIELVCKTRQELQDVIITDDGDPEAA